MAQQLEFGAIPPEILRLRDGHNKTWILENAAREMDDDDPQKKIYEEKVYDKFVPLLNKICNDVKKKGWTACIWPEGTKIDNWCFVCTKAPWEQETCMSWELI